MKIFLGKKTINIEVKKLSAVGKFTGLMFRTRNSENLLFIFSKPAKTPIHSLFVFFPFLALWLNSKNQVIESKIVSPFSLSVKPSKPAAYLIEIPQNSKNAEIFKMLVDKGKV